MIHTENLTKKFGEVMAVEGLSLDVAEGEVFGFLGPNGAGKTTTVRMLSCLIGTTGGTATVSGYKVGFQDTEIRRVVGVLTETPGMVSAQTGRLTLKMSRDWGYGGFNGDIQGLFSMHVTGPTDLARVEFFIDSTKIGELEKAPYNLQFNTDNYSLGLYHLTAIGYSSSGQEYPSNVVSANFVLQQNTMKFIILM